jgi:PAS domain S-box-containing protein
MDVVGGTVAGATLLAAALEAVAQPVWVVDGHGRIRFANPAAVAALGYADAGELIGRDSHATIHHHRPDGSPYPAAECPMLRPRTTGEAVTSELDWFFRRDGSMFRVSYASAPLDMPEGRGAVVAFTDIEDRLRSERAQRERDEMLIAQQTSLRRLAALVAGGAASADVFAAIAREVAQVIALPMVAVWRYDAGGKATVIGEWSDRPHPFRVGTSWTLDGPTITAKVLASGRPARIEDFAAIPGTIAGAARQTGIGSCAGAPIIVDGRVWGAMSADKFDPEPLAEGIEDRLAQFTALVATAISNSAKRESLALLADEQAALRRVATLVAEGASPHVVLDAAVREVRTLLDAYQVALSRFEPDEEMLVLAHCGSDLDPSAVGALVSLAGQSATAAALRTGQPARVEDYEVADSELARHARAAGVRSSVSVPVTLEGRVWGLITASWSDQPPPPGTEERMGKFAELLDTAIAGAEARAQREQLTAEQAALRRVATLVAREAPRAEVFAAIAEEIGQLLRTEEIRMVRYEDEHNAIVVASSGEAEHVFPLGARVPLGGENAVSRVLRTGQPARIDDYATASGMVVEPVRSIGIRGVVATPVVVEGRLWGAMVTGTSQDEPLPPQTESRLAQFTALMATAIANSESHARADRLADEQAALRRVATLVARESPPAEVFAGVVEESASLLVTEGVGMLRFDETEGAAVLLAQSDTPWEPVPLGTRFTLDGDNVVTAVFRTEEASRLDDWSNATGSAAAMAQTLGIRSSVGTPIVVEGRLWGTLVAVTRQAEPLPADTEPRMAEFTKLVATAISNAEARTEVQRLADKQAALRRVATLVVQESPPNQVFAAVAEEVGRLLRVEDTVMLRYEDDGTATMVATWGHLADVVVTGMRLPVDGDNIAARVRRTGQPARIDDYATASGSFGTRMRELGICAAVGCPIVVDGQLWGTMILAKRQPEPLPADTEARVAEFTELIATAISNVQARAEVARLAEEQAALRRVATLVAQGASPSSVLDAVAGEIGALLEADQVALNRFEAGDELVVLAHRGLDVARTPVGSRVSIEGESATALVQQTGRPARMEGYASASGPLAELARATGLRSSVSAPIAVEGKLWGVLTASWKKQESPPPDTESRIAEFTELVATAISNSEARAEVERLAHEQAALRRVATLVAHESPPDQVFATVAEEVGRLLRVEDTTIFRYEDDWTATVVADRGERDVPMPVGSRVSLSGESATALVRRTGRSARVDDFSNATGPLADYTRDAGIGSTVGSPIVVDGRLWGAMIAATRTDEPMPGDTESRMDKFTELVATAISNMQARFDLAASRARIVAEGDEARRRVVRDLHDGAQQRLVHTIVTLKLAQRAFRAADGKAASLLAEALEHAEQGNEELRELAHGILPAILTRGGLRAGVEAIVARIDLPVAVDVTAERFSAETEASAYFIVAEALTNVVKHSRAKRAEVRASVEDGMLHVEVRDDGIGGADPDGHGLVGMADRVTALGGRLRIANPAGGGTLVAATLPLSPSSGPG